MKGERKEPSSLMKSNSIGIYKPSTICAVSSFLSAECLNSKTSCSTQTGIFLATFRKTSKTCVEREGRIF